MQGNRRKKKRAPQSTRTVEVVRGHQGFGFTIYGQQPCILSCIVPNSSADHAGLKAGNFIISVDNVNVMKCPHDTVVQLIGNSAGVIRLTVADHYYSDSSEDECLLKPRQSSSHRSRARHGTRNKSRTRLKNVEPKYSNHPITKSCERIGSSDSTNCTIDIPSSSHNYFKKYADTSKHPSQMQNFAPKALPFLGKESILECKVIVGYLGTIEMPKQIATDSKLLTVKSCVRKLRQEKRSPTTVLMTVLPSSLVLKNSNRNVIAEYPSRRIKYASCSSENDFRYFGLVTSTTHINSNEDLDFTEEGESDVITVEVSNSCHVFAIDPKLIDHSNHSTKAQEFHITCTKDMITNTCLEFPNSADYIVNIIKLMYSLKVANGPHSLDISVLAMKSNSPANVNFARRGALRCARSRRRRDDRNNLAANSPQPSNHSEVTTTSSNSDSGIGFHNDCQNVSDRILVVDFPHINNGHIERVQREPVRPIGCYIMDNNYLSNTHPVVEDFRGQGRPLNNGDEVMINLNDTSNSYSNFSLANSNPCHSKADDSFNDRCIDIAERMCHIIDDSSTTYSGISQSKANPSHYDSVYTETEDHHYEMIKPLRQENDCFVIKDAIIYSELNEAKSQSEDCKSDNRGSIDNISVCSTHSHNYLLNKHQSRDNKIQSSVDNMLILGQKNDDDLFLHPANVKIKLKKGLNAANIISKTRQFLGREEKGKKCKKDPLSEYKLSPKVFDVSRPSVSVSADNLCEFDCVSEGGRAWTSKGGLKGATSEPSMRIGDCQHEDESDQNSALRRWAVSSGGGSYRRPNSFVSNVLPEHDMYSKQRICVNGVGGGSGSVARWSLGLEQLLADPYGAAAFKDFLDKEFSAENIRFWWSCEKYRTCGTPDMASDIWSKHLAQGAPEPVNVDAPARTAVSQRLHEAPADLFEQAQKQIFNLMKFDSYPRFLRSSQHAECARAELTCSEMPFKPEKSPQHMNSGSKLKKSASNVDERRRSSILQWSKRSASRDRSNTNPEKEERGTNFTTSPMQGSLTRLCDLCRVILPDGATTVVQVDEKQSVRQFIDRLLDRRAIHCPDYDVVLQGYKEALKQNASCSRLAGHEVRVERRVVFRLELGTSRCVAVRCRHDKSLGAVLKHVLPPMTRATRDGRLLPDDIIAKDVEGQKLQVVLVTDTETNTTTDKQTKACASLDEITNRVFEEVLQGKVELYLPPSECSLKSECIGGNEARAVVAKLRAGVNVQCTVNSSSDSPSRIVDTVAAAVPPAPAPRTSLATCKPQPAARTSVTSRLSSSSSSCEGETLNSEPPPLPPKPKVLPLKPSNWANHQNESDLLLDDSKLRRNGLAYFESAASSIV